MKHRFKRRKARVSKSVKKYVKNSFARLVETKNISVLGHVGSGAGSNFGFTGQLINVSGLAQGTNTNERVGVSIRPQRLKLRVIASGVAAQITTQCRVILFYNKLQSSNAVILSSQLLAAVGANTSAIAPINTARDANNQWHVIYDKVKICDIYGGLEKVFSLDIGKDKLPAKIHYTGTGVNDYGKNTLYLLLISNVPDATANVTPGYDLGYQLWYDDA